MTGLAELKGVLNSMSHSMDLKTDDAHRQTIAAIESYAPLPLPPSKHPQVVHTGGISIAAPVPRLIRESDCAMMTAFKGELAHLTQEQKQGLSQFSATSVAEIKAAVDSNQAGLIDVVTRLCTVATSDNPPPSKADLSCNHAALPSSCKQIWME